MGQATAGASGGVGLSVESVPKVPRGLHDWELNRLLESSAKTSAPLLITCLSGGGSGPRAPAVTAVHPQRSQPSWGTLQPWQGTLQPWQGPTLDDHPWPVSSATWHFQAEGSQESPFPPERSPQGRHHQDPCSKWTDALRYTVGFAVFHFNFFF